MCVYTLCIIVALPGCWRNHFSGFWIRREWSTLPLADGTHGLGVLCLRWANNVEPTSPTSGINYSAQRLKSAVQMNAIPCHSDQVQRSDRARFLCHMGLGRLGTSPSSIIRLERTSFPDALRAVEVRDWRGWINRPQKCCFTRLDHLHKLSSAVTKRFHLFALRRWKVVSGFFLCFVGLVIGDRPFRYHFDLRT